MNATPVRTRGLTHIALHVKDPERSARFYADVFGARVTYRDPAHVEVQTPGAQDAIAFMRAIGRRRGPSKGGVEHFGFRLRKAADVERAVEAVRAAGGTKIRSGEFKPGEPYVFFHDPDGYEVEVWYEAPRAPRPS